jgi:hypothetical protein
MVTKKTKIKKVNAKSDEQQIAELIFERTQKWARDQGLLKEEKKKYSKLAKECDKIISSAKFGCKEGAVRNLVTIITGDKLPPVTNKDKKIEFLHGVVVVPLTGNILEYYPVGEPVMIKDGAGRGIKLNGEQPDEKMYATNSKSIRPATLEEIEILIESLLKIDNFSTLLLGFILNKMGD